MTVRASFRKLVGGLVLMGLCITGLPWGCAQRHGTNVVGFRPFWGFDQSTQTSPSSGMAGSPMKPAASGLIPELWGRLKADPEATQDPFLGQPFEQANQSSPAQLAENVIENSNEAASVQSQTAGQPHAIQGNPFRLVEHQGSVREISSPEKPAATGQESQDSIPPSEPSSNPGQLDRLKMALHRDAKTELPLQSSQEGGEAIRLRVETLMKTARQDVQRGEYPQALRRAIAAEKLAARAGLFFGPEEDPPADLVRRLEDRLHLVPQVPEPIIEPFTTESIVITPALPPAEEPAMVPPLSIDFSDSEVSPAPSPGSVLLEQDLPEGGSVPYSTRAMQQATLVPESATPKPEPPLDAANVVRTLPSMPHPRSLKVDAKRVSANLGAAVSFEGQLNPPEGSVMPVLPPVTGSAGTKPELPFALSPLTSPMTNPLPVPLPSPSVVEVPQPIPPQFLYADPKAPPLLAPPKNVQWREEPLTQNTASLPWWAFPMIGGTGAVLLTLLVLRSRRSA